MPGTIVNSQLLLICSLRNEEPGAYSGKETALEEIFPQTVLQSSFGSDVSKVKKEIVLQAMLCTIIGNNTALLLRCSCARDPMTFIHH